ncbi:MAG: hypothetical protein Q7V05_12045 [Methanoregula sp.]|nr:hypothetical protein [Methanoregula sp.]
MAKNKFFSDSVTGDIYNQNLFLITMINHDRYLSGGMNPKDGSVAVQ